MRTVVEPPPAAVVGPPPRALRRRVDDVLADHLHRGALLLICNSLLLGALGFVFWAIAARLYPPAAVGSLNGLVGGVTLLATVAGVGLPNTLMRHLPTVDDPRSLFTGSVATVAVAASVLCVPLVIVAGPHLPAQLHLREEAGRPALICLLVLLTALAGLIDAALIARRRTGLVVVKNLVGNVARVALLAPMRSLGELGPLVAYVLGGILLVVVGLVMTSRVLPGHINAPAAASSLRRHAQFSVSNYVGLVFGILPLTVVPIMVLVQRGAASAAWFGVAFLITAFLNVVPSNTAQVLLTEVARDPAQMRRHALKAAKQVYLLLVPAVAACLLAGRWILAIFGPSYAQNGTTVLRVLAMAVLIGAGNYLVDALLAARDAIGSYAVINAVNSLAVLLLVGLGLHHSLVMGAVGWLVAQATALLAAMLLLAQHTGTGRSVSRNQVGEA